MADYAKLTVPNLKTLLTERSLPVSGRKDELVARLQEADSAKSGGSHAKGLDSLAPPDEEIDWDDEDHHQQAAATGTAKAAAPAKKEEGANGKQAPQAKQSRNSDFKFRRISDAFASNDTANAFQPTEEAERKRNRQLRFGIVDTAPKPEKTDRVTQKEKTLTKVQKGVKRGILTDPTEAEKAKKRAERFKT